MHGPPPSQHFRRKRIRAFIYFFLFVLGSFIAAFGWYVSWRRVDFGVELYQLAPFIAIAGHLFQLIATFAFLLMPDYETYEDDSDGSLQDNDVWNDWNSRNQ